MLALMAQPNRMRAQICEFGNRDLPPQEVCELPFWHHVIKIEHLAVSLAKLGVAKQDGRQHRGMDPRPQPHSVCSQEHVLKNQVGLNLRAHLRDRSERNLDVLVEETILYPFLDARWAVEIAIVDQGRS